jgi:AraC-like DNA-binding protein
MNPLQFHRWLRLHETRCLMFCGHLDATSLGYGNSLHFTREYKRLFGAPPMRDVEQLREGAKESVGQGTV